MVELVRDLIRILDIGVLVYFFVINTSYAVLIGLAIVEFAAYLRRAPCGGFDDSYASAFTPPVSVLMPAHNEAASIVDAVHAMLALQYPTFEVVVIDDGSTDDTFHRLREPFDLVELPRVVPTEIPVAGAARSVHVPQHSPVPLLVMRKANGGKTDALSVGVNLVQYPLVCMVDADSVLDSNALLGSPSRSWTTRSG